MIKIIKDINPYSKYKFNNIQNTEDIINKNIQNTNDF